MKEKSSVQELAGKSELRSIRSRDEISDGILLGPAPQIRRIRLKCESASGTGKDFSPVMVL